MQYRSHPPVRPSQPNNQLGRKIVLALIGTVTALFIVGGGILLINLFTSSEEPAAEETARKEVVFEDSLSASEQSFITSAIADQNIVITGSISISATLQDSAVEPNSTVGVYVPVTAFGSVLQSIVKADLVAAPFTVSSSVDDITVQSIAAYAGVGLDALADVEGEIGLEQIVFIPLSELDSTHQLLTLDGAYYLDSFTSGALFRSIVVSGESATDLADLSLGQSLADEDVYTVNMTGVTALTRGMQLKLQTVKDPLYFNENIGEFLADADTTHISNEVSFADNCAYSRTVFCSPPEFIETLKASGVDIVELTGNHNNDLGSDTNADSIKLYQELGWATIGGGLNAEEAALPHIETQKGSTVAFLAYNYPNSPSDAAIAGVTTAGANPFDFSFASIEADIASAKQSSDFVIVNIQYWECYSYPDGYIEFPQCDSPIGEQEPTFKRLIDLGADMVVGSAAHQPQTYELYEGKPIFYGLGNLYFDQTNWPGTERGLVITNYFVDGVLLQVKITPTVYGKDLQTRIMTPAEAEYLLGRLKDAR